MKLMKAKLWLSEKTLLELKWKVQAKYYMICLHWVRVRFVCTHTRRMIVCRRKDAHSYETPGAKLTISMQQTPLMKTVRITYFFGLCKSSIGYAKNTVPHYLEPYLYQLQLPRAKVLAQLNCETSVDICICAERIQQPMYLKDCVKQVKDSMLRS